MNNVYGYLCNGSFVETGLTQTGAKIAATKANSRFVGYRSYVNNMYVQTSIKHGDNWHVQQPVTDYQQRAEQQ